MTQFLLPFLFPTIRRRGWSEVSGTFVRIQPRLVNHAMCTNLTRRYDMLDVICTVYVSTLLLVSMRLCTLHYLFRRPSLVSIARRFGIYIISYEL
jgi:hypothetical protein